MHFTGIIIAVSTFLIIGMFHPIVIKAEYYTGTRLWWVFLALGIAAIVGAMFIENGEKVTLPPPKGDCIDATGAGDAFMGGFLYALAEGKKLSECVRFALAAGTATAGVKGCYADRSVYEKIRIRSGAEKNNGNI